MQQGALDLFGLNQFPSALEGAVGSAQDFQSVFCHFT
jgi:hypothetical protein